MRPTRQPPPRRRRIRSGTQAELWFDPERMHVFDASTGENLTRDPNRAFDDDRVHAGIPADDAPGRQAAS